MPRRAKSITLAPHRPVGQAEIVDESGSVVGVSVAEDESALMWLWRRKGSDGAPLISAAQFAAGERLRQDYTAGQLGQRVTADWEAVIVPGRSGARARLEPAERAVAAKRQFFAALDAVGPELSGILWEVCCLAAGIEQAERRLALPQRSGKAVLGLALTRLARHYGYEKAPAEPSGRRGIRQWGRDGFRPVIA
jgi:Domain of unknown function (DUF6456)